MFGRFVLNRRLTTADNNLDLSPPPPAFQ